MIHRLTVRVLHESDYLQVAHLDSLSGSELAEMLDTEMVYGIFYRKRLVGYCSIGGADDPSMGYYQFPEWTMDSVVICDVFVLPEFRHCKFATLMLERILRKQTNPIFLTILDAKLQPFYEKFGFKMLDNGTMVKMPGGAA